MSENFLAFADKIGKNIEGKNIYRLDFTKAIDVVWGIEWNATPAGIEPNIQPDINCLSVSCNFDSDEDFLLARTNTCFSMQDCIDGILPLLFSEPYSENHLILPFGMPMDEVEKALSELGITVYDIKNVNEDKDNEVIDNLIDNLEGQMGNDNNTDEDIDF